MQTPIRVLMWSLASTPVAWLFLFGLFVLRARIELGRWPVPYQPDPKDLGFHLHHAALLVGIPLMFAAALSAIGLTLFVHERPRRAWLIRLTALAGVAALFVVAQADPGYVFTWFGD